MTSNNEKIKQSNWMQEGSCCLCNVFIKLCPETVAGKDRFHFFKLPSLTWTRYKDTEQEGALPAFLWVTSTRHLHPIVYVVWGSV